MNPTDRINRMIRSGELTYAAFGIASSTRGRIYFTMNRGAEVIARGYGDTFEDALSSALSQLPMELPI